MLSFPNKLKAKIEAREQEDALRILKTQENLIDFYSNDYLGLARNLDLQENIFEALKNHEFGIGSTGSRLISGNYQYIAYAEEFMAAYFKSENGLFFSSGYLANVGVFSSIPQKDDVIFYDELSHACIKDGIRLSFADKFAFKHNDVEELESKIKKLGKGTIYIAIESIYSMDGDTAPIEAIVAIAQKYNAYIIVDEAHSTGTCGEFGQGFCVSKNLENNIFLRIHTFGKAMGCHGAFVACSEETKSFLINFSRPFIYTTAPSFHQVLCAVESIKYLKENNRLIFVLKNKISYFKSQIDSLGLSPKFLKSESSIQVFMLSGNDLVKKLAQNIQNSGFNVKPILAPTIKKGQERIRLCLHTYNEDSEINKILCHLLI